MQEANLGTEFTGHATRSAASAAAALAGVLTQEIMDRAGWSRENTFCQFYYKPSEKTASVQRFTKAVLANAISKQRTCSLSQQSPQSTIREWLKLCKQLNAIPGCTEGEGDINKSFPTQALL